MLLWWRIWSHPALRWQLCIPSWRNSSSILPWWHLSSKDSWMILLYWPFQFGFRPECGTETTLVTLADDLYWELDRRNTSLLVLLNLSTAVNHLSGPLCRDVLAGAVLQWSSLEGSFWKMVLLDFWCWWTAAVGGHCGWLFRASDRWHQHDVTTASLSLSGQAVLVWGQNGHPFSFRSDILSMRWHFSFSFRTSRLSVRSQWPSDGTA